MKIKKQDKGSSKLRDSVPYTALQVTEVKTEEDENGNEKSTSQGKKLRTAALVVSWMSVLFAFFTGVAALVLGQILDNQSLFGYGLDGVLDSLSSVAVLWRFHGSGTSVVVEARERKACIIISIFFFASALSLGIKSAIAIAYNNRENEEARVLTDAFSIVCGAVAFFLATIKVYLGRKLNSRSLMTDSIITYAGSAMSFLGVIGLELYKSNDTIWYLDSTFGLACSLFLIGFGLKLLIDMTCRYKIMIPITDTT